MERIKITPRNKWQQKLETLGFGFHTTNIPYWDESVYYRFTLDEILSIEQQTTQLWEMCLDAVQCVIDNKLYKQFCIPDFIVPLINKSWNEYHPSIYCRFDLCYSNGELKLLECNADTPTSLFEMAVVQWYWLQEFDASKDQFNSAHEKLIACWSYLKNYLYPDKLHFACVKRSLEDLTTTEYLRDCAIQSGIETNLLFMDDIGWMNNQFVDLENKPIKNIFKLYPWEFMLNEKFGSYLTLEEQKAFWIEPPWKMILSNKAILPLLYDLYKDNPMILPAYYERPMNDSFVKKPIFGREGANIDIIKQGKIVQQTKGDYGTEGFIYQELAELPNYENHYPLIGSWIIGQEPAGIGIRESDTLITNNTSRFVPHLIS